MCASWVDIIVILSFSSDNISDMVSSRGCISSIKLEWFKITILLSVVFIDSVNGPTL